jgi:hypothetical protein
MQRWLTGDDLANEIGMLRAALDARAFVLLEGPNDCRALDPHIDEASAMSFAAHGKRNAERAIELLEARGFEHVLAVLDRDWVDMLDPPLSSANVVYTDDYDLDATVMLAGTVLERLVSALSDRDRREAHLSSVGLDAEHLALQLAGPIGLLRFLSRRDGHELRCEDFPVHEAIASTRASVDIQQICVIAVARAVRPNIAASAAGVFLTAELENQTDLRAYCCGHDLAAVLSVLVRHWGGSASRSMLEAVSRAAFGCADLATTSLFAAVRDWAQSVDVSVWSCPCE